MRITALFTPKKTDGLKTTVTAQVPSYNIGVELQSLDWLNSAASVPPEIYTELILRSPLPAFLILTDFVLDSEPPSISAKLIYLGLAKIKGGGAWPERFRVTTGLLGSFEEMTIAPLFLPNGFVGVSHVMTIHELPACRVLQLFVCLKSAVAPDRVTESIVSSDLPIFLIVMPICGDILPTFTAPKLMFSGVNEILGEGSTLKTR
ncbi:MAG TPA: hypothetical protein VK435_07385 [Thermodesulfovibrionales bacterium]|nr:hypothetical protein [Thermodesulfovibrionales bacterium]